MRSTYNCNRRVKDGKAMNKVREMMKLCIKKMVARQRKSDSFDSFIRTFRIEGGCTVDRILSAKLSSHTVSTSTYQSTVINDDEKV